MGVPTAVAPANRSREPIYRPRLLERSKGHHRSRWCRGVVYTGCWEGKARKEAAHGNVGEVVTLASGGETTGVLGEDTDDAKERP